MPAPHVPPPNPENFHWLEMDQTLNLLYDGLTPVLSITLRKVEHEKNGPPTYKIALQVTADARFEQKKRSLLTD